MLFKDLIRSHKYLWQYPAVWFFVQKIWDDIPHEWSGFLGFPEVSPQLISLRRNFLEHLDDQTIKNIPCGFNLVRKKKKKYELSLSLMKGKLA